MKKVILYGAVLVVILIFGCIFYYTRPIDDTKMLHISCNDFKQEYDVMINDEIKFADGDSKCGIDLKVVNIDRGFIKLNSKTFFYKVNGDETIDKLTLDYDVYVPSDGNIILVGHDKETRFEFSFK